MNRTDLLRAIGDRVGLVRYSLGFTVKDLARTSGVSASTIYSVERGERQPTLELLFLLAEGLEIDPRQLVPDPEAYADGGPAVNWAQMAEQLPDFRQGLLVVNYLAEHHALRISHKQALLMMAELDEERLT